MRKFQFEGKGNVSGDRVRELRPEPAYHKRPSRRKMQTEGAIIEQDAVSRIESGSRLVTDYELLAMTKIFQRLRRLDYRRRQKPAPGLISRGGYFLQKTIDILQAV